MGQGRCKVQWSYSGGKCGGAETTRTDICADADAKGPSTIPRVKASHYVLSRVGRDIVLVIQGHLTEEQAAESTAKFKVLVGSAVVRFIVDFGGMSGYDPPARTMWAKALAPMRSQISIIFFVGNPPPLVKMAASAVALAIGVPMKFVKERGEVPTERQTLLDDDEP